MAVQQGSSTHVMALSPRREHLHEHMMASPMAVTVVTTRMILVTLPLASRH
jgi:hypothetical protein